MLFIANCGGDYRPQASGTFGDAVVIMDSTQWESETAQAIREVYGQGIETLPQWEPMMDLRFQDFKNNDELERLRKNKNIIVAAPLSDSSNTADFVRALISDDVEEKVKENEVFAFPLEDQWYKNQWSVILTSESDSVLAKKIRDSKETLANQLLDTELKRWTYDIYEKAEQKNVSDSLWIDHGWKIRVQHDWRPNIDTTYSENGKKNHFVTMRRNLPKNQRWFWAWWIEDAPPLDSLSADWINTKRDSLMEKWIRGTREQSYVTTDYEYNPVITDTLALDGHTAFETEGVWRMTNDAMAGPFVNMTVYDENRDRLFMLEFGQFAPNYDKRRFVRQFQAMLRTFESDSSWNAGKTEVIASGE
jgi:hypothetical protein